MRWVVLLWPVCVGLAGYVLAVAGDGGPMSACVIIGGVMVGHAVAFGRLDVFYKAGRETPTERANDEAHRKLMEAHREFRGKARELLAALEAAKASMDAAKEETE